MKDLVIKLWEVAASGGPVMFALLLLAIARYRRLAGLIAFFGDRNLSAVEASCDTARLARIEERRRAFARIARAQLRYARALLVAAPLLGLLGTVIGMFDTFKGLSGETSQGTLSAVADGIKVALVTTQTGLMIAILGLFATQWIERLRRRRDQELNDLRLQLLLQLRQP